MKEIPENVKQFAEQCEQAAMQFRRDFISFGNFMITDKAESPIECLFGLALEALIEVNKEELNFIGLRDDGSWIYSTGFIQQAEIGKYRADFLLYYNALDVVTHDFAKKIDRAYEDYKYTDHRIIVELDGHEFHEKDEKQRRYEKARDRYFQRLGLKVFHYTGSEIVKDPMKAALESLASVTGKDAEGLWLPMTNYWEEA